MSYTYSFEYLPLYGKFIEVSFCLECRIYLFLWCHGKNKRIEKHKTSNNSSCLTAFERLHRTMIYSSLDGGMTVFVKESRVRFALMPCKASIQKHFVQWQLNTGVTGAVKSGGKGHGTAYIKVVFSKGRCISRRSYVQAAN